MVKGGPVFERLMHLHPKVIDLSLDRVEALLERLGHPERSLPPVVHVSGTNGKGSVIAYTRAALEAAGYRVHVYTSPHLARFNERIRLAGRLIDDGPLIALLEECERVNAGAPITFFEITTAAAFLAFARTPADAVLLETGLGGRLDATNVIDRPTVTAITPVSLDHQQYLGDTLAAIAGEKAGILKPGVPCVLSRQPPEAEPTIVARAAAVGAPLLKEGVDWSVAPEGARTFVSGAPAPDGGGDDGLVFASGGTRLPLPRPRLLGDHQINNAGAALATLQVLRGAGFRIPETALVRAMTDVEWPARLQRLVQGPLVTRLPVGWQLWLDGGHNPAAGQVLAAQARRWHQERPRLPLYLIGGMLNSKDPVGFFRPLAGLAESVRTVAIPGEANSLSAEALATVARDVGLKAAPATSVEEALSAIVAAARRPTRVLICGSLYLAGTVLTENG
jgi:dihydrofolate synthase/folylpolyglutamate synthase